MFIKPFFKFFYRYEEAREEEKLRSQREDFSDMVAEVCGYFVSSLYSIFPDHLTFHWVVGFTKSTDEIKLLQNEKKRKRKMQEKDGKSKKKDFKFWGGFGFIYCTM